MSTSTAVRSLAHSPAGRTFSVLGSLVVTLGAGACAAESSSADVENPASILVVSPGTTVTAPADTCAKGAGTITVEGTLVVPDDKDIEICATSILVQGGGHLIIGSEASPFKHRATITLQGTDPTVDVMKMGTKFVGAMGGGIIDIHGTPPKTTWTKLEGPVAAGAKSLKVLDASGWRVGDEIVIASSVVDAAQTETRRIAAVAGNLVTLDKALTFARVGTVRTVDGRTVDTRTEVGALSRNIVIRGDAASDALRFGGHMMIMTGGKAFVDGVEFQRMGQFGRLGRYPFHWHLAGDIQGQYIRSSVVNRSFQRGIVVHGVQHALVEGNIVFDTPGHNYIAETADTVSNTWNKNLGLVTRIANFTAPILSTQRDEEPANFWIRAAKNTFTGNSAAGSIAAGFWYDEVADGGTTFDGNVAHSATGFATDAPDQKARLDFNRESGLLVQFANNDEAGPQVQATNTFKNSTLFQNNVDLWPQDGVFTFDRFVFGDPGAQSVTVEGCYAIFESPLFAGGGANGTSATAVGMQYNGKAILRNPTFSKLGTPISSNDIFAPWMADFVISGAKFLDMSKNVVGPDDLSVLETLDNSFVPKGFYTVDEVPLKAPTSVPAPGFPGFLLNTTRVTYATITAAIGENRVSIDTTFVRRSDGVRYSDPGQEGLRAITNSALSYQLETMPAGSAVDLYLDVHENGHQVTAPPAVDDIFLELAVPATRAPLKLTRSAADGGALVKAASLAAFRAAPKTTYFYDAVAKLTYARLTPSPLTITP